MNEVIVAGPVFDGRAIALGAKATQAVRDAVAAEGARLVGAAFAASIRNGTGAFLDSITVVDRSTVFTTDGYSMSVSAGPDTDIVTTDIASYGPWLEGVGSRNETTAFKGYHGYRQAAQELDTRAQAIAATAAAPFVEAMN